MEIPKNVGLRRLLEPHGGINPFLLVGETVESVNKVDLQIRRKNANTLLEKMTDDDFEQINLLQVQVGCPNVCSHCSVESGNTTTIITKRGTSNLVASIRAAAIKRLSYINSLPTFDDSGKPSVPLISQGRKGIVHAYFDDDPMSVNSDINHFVKLVHENLGVTIKYTTVGWSRHNKKLQAAHEEIARDFPDALNTVRLSISGFTYGWASENSGVTSRKEMIADIANVIHTYSSLNKNGDSKFHVKFRFPAYVEDSVPLQEKYINNYHHVLHIGPHLLISINPNQETLPVSHIRDVQHGGIRKSIIDQPGRQYLLITDDALRQKEDIELYAQAALEKISTEPAYKIYPNSRIVDIFKFENSDGPYYASNPTFLEDGTFRALHIYPKTDHRRSAGYNNAERLLLNSLITYKSSLRLTALDAFPEASWTDVENTIKIIKARILFLDTIDSRYTQFVRNSILPLIEGYVEALKLSGSHPSLFFDPNFTSDTGQIMNQGRIGTFKNIVSAPYIPITPHEDRSNFEFEHDLEKYGDSIRIAPLPRVVKNERKMNKKQVGVRNMKFFDPKTTQRSEGVVVVSNVRWEDRHPSEHYFTLNGIESYPPFTFKNALSNLLIPGIVHQDESNYFLLHPPELSEIQSFILYDDWMTKEVRSSDDFHGKDHSIRVLIIGLNIARDLTQEGYKNIRERELAWALSLHDIALLDGCGNFKIHAIEASEWIEEHLSSIDPDVDVKFVSQLVLRHDAVDELFNPKDEFSLNLHILKAADALDRYRLKEKNYPKDEYIKIAHALKYKDIARNFAQATANKTQDGVLFFAKKIGLLI